MIYHKGTIEQFNAWHNNACKLKGIPRDVQRPNGEVIKDAVEAYSSFLELKEEKGQGIWLAGDCIDESLAQLRYEDCVSNGYIQTTER